MMDLHEWLTFGNTPDSGSRGSSTRATLTPTFHIEISLREMRESFVEAPLCDIQDRKLHGKASAKRVQDLDKGDIIGGGELHTCDCTRKKKKLRSYDSKEVYTYVPGMGTISEQYRTWRLNVYCGWSQLQVLRVSLASLTCIKIARVRSRGLGLFRPVDLCVRAVLVAAVSAHEKRRTQNKCKKSSILRQCDSKLS